MSHRKLVFKMAMARIERSEIMNTDEINKHYVHKTGAKANIRRGEASGSDAARRPEEVRYYPLYMTMFV